MGNGDDCDDTPMPSTTAIPAPASAQFTATLTPAMTAEQLPAAAAATTNILPTGQEVHVMDDGEFDALRRKLQMQTASRRYRRRKKEQTSQKNAEIQELREQLARLHELEADHVQYQQRSVESLEEELEQRRKEVEELSLEVETAAKEELDWVRLRFIQSTKDANSFLQINAVNSRFRK